MNAWIGDICQHIKSVAPNALVGIGYEGFYGSGARTALNPAGGWAQNEGPNFLEHAGRSCA